MNLIERNKKNKEFFNEKAKNYDNRHIELGLMSNKEKITDVLNENTKDILDLGVGTGLELIALFKRFPNAKVRGIDITDGMLEVLKTREFAQNVEIICDDFFDVDFGENTYDAVISSAALHHFSKSQKKELYQKIYRSLKCGGQFINSDKFAKDEKEELNQFQEFKRNINPEAHIDTPLTIENEEQILKIIGFKNIQFKEIGSDKYKLLMCNK